MKRGDKFIHAYWLDENGNPLECEVTRIARGCAYYKAVRDGKLSGAPMVESLENMHKRNKEQDHERS